MSGPDSRGGAALPKPYCWHAVVAAGKTGRSRPRPAGSRGSAICTRLATENPAADGGCVPHPAPLMLQRMITGMHRSVALVSGGLDSLVSLAKAREETDVRLVLFADYGQRAAARERAAVVGIATFYGLPYGEVDLGWMRDLSPEGMRSGAPSGGKPPRLGNARRRVDPQP